jgi:hypothetical protein
MGNYGSAVSLRGYDVKTCAERFLVYSSSFQVLKIFMKVKVTGTLPITIYHNLGHFCPFEVIAHNAPEYAYQDWKRIPFSDGAFYESVNARCYTDRIVLVNGEFDPEVSNSYTVIIYLDNFSTVSENTINTGASSGSYSQNYGMRISKAGYDVKTCTDEQCVLSSKQGFSEIIHKKGINTERSGQCEISHNQGVPLKFLAFQKKTSESFITPTIRRGRTTLTLDGAYITSNKLYIGVDTGAGGFSNDYDFYYIMFKNRL